MNYEFLIQQERDLSESILLLMRLSNQLASENVGGFAKVLHAELHLRTVHNAMLQNFAEAQ